MRFGVCKRPGLRTHRRGHSSNTQSGMDHFAEPLRPPDLHITGLRLWVHGRQFPMADGYWDSNWLQVTVHCAAPGARVWVTGPILHVPEIAHFLRGIEVLHASLQGEATLPCMEPELAVTLTAEGLGHITMIVAITLTIFLKLIASRFPLIRAICHR